MNDNKGFTLIELIATIAILAILSLVVGMSITNMISNQNGKKYNEYVKKLEDAACVYAEKLDSCKNPKSCNITFETLIDNGLIKKDLLNPNNNESVSNQRSKTVNVYWENNEKKCKYSE